MDDENKEVFESSGSQTDVLILNEKSDLNVIITWGDMEESFELELID